jgi:hypothetical protein
VDEIGGEISVGYATMAFKKSKCVIENFMQKKG